MKYTVTNGPVITGLNDDQATTSSWATPTASSASTLRGRTCSASRSNPAAPGSARTTRCPATAASATRAPVSSRSCHMSTILEHQQRRPTSRRSWPSTTLRRVGFESIGLVEGNMYFIDVVDGTHIRLRDANGNSSAACRQVRHALPPGPGHRRHERCDRHPAALHRPRRGRSPAGHPARPDRRRRPRQTGRPARERRRERDVDGRRRRPLPLQRRLLRGNRQAHRQRSRSRAARSAARASSSTAALMRRRQSARSARAADSSDSAPPTRSRIW